MRIKKYLALAILGVGIISCSGEQKELNSENETSPIGRAEYEFEKLKDPATGKIPVNIRVRELAFASTLPKSYTKSTRASLQIFEPIGPRNVGGRTRAISFDVDSSNVILAGGVSGGMWRSRDFGTSWKRATNFEDQSAVSCVKQDIRSGKTNVFYYGSGENIGNSASKSFSAPYIGSGLYKSTDHGITWNVLPSTSVLPHKGGAFKYIFNVAIDPSRNDSDIIYAATYKGIQRSNDGGSTWKLILDGSSGVNSNVYTNIIVTSNGNHYATISSDGNQKGFWRSDDGLTWANISPSDIPSNHDKTLIAEAPSNPNIVYFYSVTPGKGSSDVSFWKYTYQSGNGAGSNGVWENRSNNLPPAKGYSLNTQGSYCMSLAVKPNDENTVFLGATNLFRSTVGFASSNSMNQIGGYGADGYVSWDYYEDNQHPDQQSLAFLPNDPNQLLAGTDGGLHFTTNCIASKVVWQSFNNGYQTTQFYGMAIDHLTENEIVTSGYQDNGSWWTNSADTLTDWIFEMGGDGAYCAKEEGTEVYYFSSQNGYIRRMKLNASGVRIGSTKNVRPPGVSSGYLFNHPYVLDASDNNRMYLPIGSDIWRNSDLNGLDNNQNNWTNLGSVSNTITAVDASKSDPGVVYFGTNSRKIYRMEDDGTANPTITEISSGITNGGYTSNITIDPYDANKVIVIYSNYNTISGWYTEDGGTNWINIEGNLKGVSDPGVPPQLGYIGSGPSFRWARFISTDYGTVVLLGTSVGLFATNDLDATEINWIQQASDVIGNVVIEQIDHRISDGFCVVATHGAGAYKTYFENNYDITSVENVSIDKLKIVAYPNPVINSVNIEFVLDQTEQIRLDIMNSNGQVVKTQFANSSNGKNTSIIDLSEFTSGVYYVTLRSKSGDFTIAIIKQ